MTGAPQTPPLHFATVDQAIDAMRSRGLRLSTARRLVLQALFATAEPVSAHELSRQLAIDTTSVYRNLELFEGFGVVRHVHLAHGAGLYVLAGRQEREYLYCEQCSSVRAVAVEELEPVRELIRAQFGFHARFTHFAIVGTCQQCAAQQQPPRARQTITTPAPVTTQGQPVSRMSRRGTVDGRARPTI